MLMKIKIFLSENKIPLLKLSIYSFILFITMSLEILLYEILKLIITFEVFSFLVIINK
jgi:hypothetical protein